MEGGWAMRDVSEGGRVGYDSRKLGRGGWAMGFVSERGRVDHGSRK